MMEKFYIITNVSKDPYMKVTSRIQNYLQSRGKKSVLCINDKEGRIVPDTIPKKVDMAIVIGGDGTLIRAARDLFGRKIPLLGVNMGTLGYLTEVELGDIEDAIDQIIDGNYCLEPRMMLEGLFKGGQKENALNDIVVSRKRPYPHSKFSYLCKWYLLEFLSGGRNHCLYAYGLHSLQSVSRWTGSGANCRADRDHTDLSSFSEFAQHYFGP